MNSNEDHSGCNVPRKAIIACLGRSRAFPGALSDPRALSQVESGRALPLSPAWFLQSASIGLLLPKRTVSAGWDAHHWPNFWESSRILHSSHHHWEDCSVFPSVRGLPYAWKNRGCSERMALVSSYWPLLLGPDTCTSKQSLKKSTVTDIPL